jgi:hypothetical protein
MKSQYPKSKSQIQRRGSSLAEVLVALLVMSIGVVSVASLFPISVLRTVQATQLTNSAQLKYDFDGLSGPRPEIVTGVGEWQPQKAYSKGDLVISTVGNNRYFEWQPVYDATRTSGALEPSWKWSTGATTDDGAVPEAWMTHLAVAYMVDPLGWEERSLEMIDRSLAVATNTSDIRNTFGRPTLAGVSFPVNSSYRIVRFRGGVAGNIYNPASTMSFPTNNTRAGATGTCVLPDSWLVQVDTTDVVSYTSTSIQVNATDLVNSLDLNADNVVDFTQPNGAEQAIICRVTLYGPDNRQSVIRQISTITRPGSEQINWATPLPTPFTPVRVRVETFQTRFSWMLAARRQVSGAIYMDLITFYKRSFDPNHELIHPAHFRTGTWLGPDNTLNTADDVTDPTVVIQYNPDLGNSSPALRRGGFICDAQNNRWYRIINFTEVPNSLAALTSLDPNAIGTALGTTRGAIVRLEYTVSTSSGIYTPSDNAAPGGVLVLPGIINVYPLQPKLPWEE